MTGTERRIRKRMAALESLVKSMNQGIKSGSEFSVNLEETETSMQEAQAELVNLKTSLEQINKYGPLINLFWFGTTCYLGTLVYKDLNNG